MASHPSTWARRQPALARPLPPGAGRRLGRVDNLRLEAAGEQALDHGEVPILARDVEGRGAARVADGHIRLGLQEHINHLHIAALACDEEARGARRDACVHVRLVSERKQADNGSEAHGGREVERGAPAREARMHQATVGSRDQLDHLERPTLHGREHVRCSRRDGA